MTDRRGGFAMGALHGARFRKYHGFYLRVASRGGWAGLVDLELHCDGTPLWPHWYLRQGDGAMAAPFVRSPDPGALNARITEAGSPEWRWDLARGSLVMRVERREGGGIRLAWQWSGSARVDLRLRPFFAMRGLHELGGRQWELARSVDGSAHEIRSAAGLGGAPPIFLEVSPGMTWSLAADWYRSFAYAEELERGYPAIEDLFSAGEFHVELDPGRAVSWSLSERPPSREARAGGASIERVSSAAADFALVAPPGIVAGFPWFGEWGRDTFISLPGLVAELGPAADVWSWCSELLARWGRWIAESGMLPNLLAETGEPQWESADATLWWTHSLASLWQLTLAQGLQARAEALRHEFGPLLELAIRSIRAGRHRHLSERPTGILEVTTPHSTWMDARVDGRAVTPRLGALPEINALWFQAHCLHKLWLERPEPGGIDQDQSLLALGLRILEDCREPSRPNSVFFYSLPLAPAFVLCALEGGRIGDLRELKTKFLTPVGLRTLDPSDPEYRPRCEGDQRQRDLAYHQGTVWAWLGGHYEMARERFDSEASDTLVLNDADQAGPVSRHVAEIFDAEPPHTPRGAPAQAWSLACLAEVRARKRLRADAKLTELLARRWLDRRERRGDKESG